MKKLFILFLMTIFLVGLVSSAEWDNVKSYDETTKTITITNILGLGSDLETATLKSNTYECGQFCSAEKEITLYNEGILIDDVRFYRIDGENVYLSNIRNYQLSYYGDVPEYTYEGKVIETLENGTEIKDYIQIQVGSHKEWIMFSPSDKFSAGTYQVRLTGEKRPDWSYDWQVNLQGKWTTEWATWGNISAGSQAEVTLISPVDKTIQTTNSVTYNASANVTGGSFLVNISLWTNSTGTWHRNSTVTFQAGIANAIQSHNELETNNAADSSTWGRGLLITATSNVTLTKVTMFPNSAGSSVGLLYYNQTSIVNSTITSKNATFNVPLIAGERYLLCNLGQTVSGWGATTITFPYNDTYINFNSSLDCNGFSEQNNVVREVLSITVNRSGTDYAAQTFSSILPLSNTTWNVQACDTDGACGWNNASSPTNNRTITYSPLTTINLNTPVNNTNSTNTYMVFNPIITDIGGGIINVTLIINGLIYNSNSSGYNGTYTFNQSLIDGNYNWTINASSIGGITEGGTRFFTLAKSFVNNFNYNLTTYETAEERYYVNITTNGSVPTANFTFNGTTYSATVTNTNSNDFNLSSLIQIPLSGDNINRSFYFSYTLNGVGYDTATRGQNVSELVFTNSNSTYSNDFLNISYKDEVTLVTINASIPSATFVYYLGNGTINKTYSYVNSTNQFNHTFSGYPTNRNINVLPVVQYKQGTDYPQRIWQPTLKIYNSIVYNQILYLLSSTDGIYVTFQMINSADQTIGGVSANATKTSDGTLINAGTTDDAGLITFFLNPDIEQTFCFSKSGYTTQCTTLFPTQSAYTITMSSTTSTSSDYGKGIIKTISPSTDFLDRYGIYSFNYTLNSSFWTVQKFEFRLYYSNGTLIISNSSTNSGGTISYNSFNVSNTSSVSMYYSYIINDSAQNFTRQWAVQSTEGRAYSIWNFFTDLTLYIDSSNGLWGIDDFSKSLLSVLLIILTVGMVGSRYGINNEATIMAILFGVVFFLDVSLGFIPRISFDTPLGTMTAFQNFPTILTFIILFALVIREERR